MKIIISCSLTLHQSSSLHTSCLNSDSSLCSINPIMCHLKVPLHHCSDVAVNSQIVSKAADLTSVSPILSNCLNTDKLCSRLYVVSSLTGSSRFLYGMMSSQIYLDVMVTCCSWDIRGFSLTGSISLTLWWPVMSCTWPWAACPCPLLGRGRL